MKSIITFVTLLFSFSGIFGQTKDSASYYYSLGNEELGRMNYTVADSLYSLSLKYFKHPDTYFNQALARKKLGNMKGYCIDLSNAANLRDTAANKLFWKNCIKIDTLYYNKDNSNASKYAFSYMDIISKCIYTTDCTYKRFNIDKNIIVSAEVINDDTLFYTTPNPPKYPEDEKEIVENLKYVVPQEDDIKKEKIHTIIIAFTVLENGSMNDIKILTLGVDKKYEEEIINVFKKYTRTWIPARYNGIPVKFRKKIMYRVKYVEKNYGEK